LRVDGVETIVEGGGPKTIVMIHGWPDTHRLWDRQVDALKSRYRCVRFTLPGFEPGAPKGARPFDALLATVRNIVKEACPGARVTLLLHDWGCFFGYQFAMRYPELVERVVGVDIGDGGSRQHGAELGAKGMFIILAYQMWLALAWRIGGRIGDAMARAMARAMPCPSVDSRQVNAQMGYPYAMRWLGVAGGFRGLAVFKPQVPMLFMYGERKPIMFHSRAWAERVAALPGNRVSAFPTGHWIMVQQPVQFNAALLDWLAETDEPAG
jgi:cis-3-alkyl-4-acyloxetan-2-one decarboxylase